MFNEDRSATQSEAYNEMVQNIGLDRQDQEWILTPFDTWEHNPNYDGPPQPHPEADDSLGDDPRMYPGEENTPYYDDRELDELTKPDSYDNIPS